jgi:putative intracellular protease/amidase
MKRLFSLFLLCGILVSCDKNAPRVLLYIEGETSHLEYMLIHEVGKMREILKKDGFDVTIATLSGDVLKTDSITVKPDLKLSEVNIDEYAGFILPCMVSDFISPEMITFVKTIVDKGKPIAAQTGSVALLAKAGILNGKKYTFNHDVSMNPDFKSGIYCGTGVVQDGVIITSGVCPWIANGTGWEDGTAKLTQTLIDAIKAKTK